LSPPPDLLIACLHPMFPASAAHIASVQSSRSGPGAGAHSAHDRNTQAMSSEQSRTSGSNPPTLAFPLRSLAPALILILGLSRLFTFVGHDPVLGYANNHDMVRIQACHQVWPHDTTIDRKRSTGAAPLERYTFSQVEAVCLPSSELIFTFITTTILHAYESVLPLDSFSIRLFGLTRALALATAGIFFFAYLTRKRLRGASLVHSLLFTLVLVDPVNTLYLNTFYAEFSAFFFFYTSLGLLYCLGASGSARSLSGALGLSLFLLGTSRLQHILLPVIFLLVLIAVSWPIKETRKVFQVGLACLAILSSLLFHWDHTRTRNGKKMGLANATDTFLLTVLPAASDVTRASEILGLPSHCLEHVGKSWYTKGMQRNHPCPEVADVPRFRIVTLSVLDPAFFATVTTKGLDRIRPWLNTFVGHVGGAERRSISQETFTIAAWPDHLSRTGLIVLFGLPGLVLIWAAYKGARRSFDYETAVCVVLAMTTYTVFYSALFGDGYIELLKHAHLYFSAVTSLGIIFPATVYAQRAS
jgi:hypothetical protein